VCSTTTPVASYQVKKTESASTLSPGQKVTYSIAVTNVGEVAYTAANAASFSDDLTKVLDDATYDNDASNGATYSAPTLSWSGPLAVGATTTVAYSATVNSPDTGDGKLTNTVVTPPTAGGFVQANCPAGSTDPSCTVAATVTTATPSGPPPTPTPTGPATIPRPPATTPAAVATTPVASESPLSSIVSGHGWWGPGGPTGKSAASAGVLLLMLGGVGLLVLRRRRRPTLHA
jgi:uncharacterized repeat protein (TIGR01451 family)